MCVCLFLGVCVSAGARGQKGALDPLDVEFRLVGSCLTCVSEANFDPLQEQQEPLTAELSLSPKYNFILFFKKGI